MYNFQEILLYYQCPKCSEDSKLVKTVVEALYYCNNCFSAIRFQELKEKNGFHPK